MSNYRVVHIIGTIPEKYFEELPNKSVYDNIKSFINNCNNIEHFKSEYRGLSFINNWISPHVNSIGIIGKCSLEVDELIEEWKFIVNKFPEINLKIHICGNYESEKCLLTIIIKDFYIELVGPEIEKIKLNNQQNKFDLAMMLVKNHK